MIAVAKQIGFEMVEWENQARPTQWVQGIEYAINNKFDAIDMLGGTDPAVLGPQVLQAKKAGVKIFVSHLYDTNQTPDPNVDLSLPIPYHEVGRILAAWVAMQTQGKANVLVIGSDEIVPTKSYVKGFTDGLAKMNFRRASTRELPFLGQHHHDPGLAGRAGRADLGSNYPAHCRRLRPFCRERADVVRDDRRGA
jgi:ABC-type sugar transport system substrate-binding protein